MDWLARSLLVSLALTVLLNVALRWWQRRPRRPVSQHPQPPAWRLPEPTWQSERVKVWVPWKAMLVASLVLTVVLNLALLLR